jgi:hypothetical protein
MSSCMLEEEKTRVRAKYKEFLRQRNIQGSLVKIHRAYFTLHICKFNVK